jgi:hypothetical protein
MTATGGGLALLTLPVVGVQAWLDWLHVGQLAADAYNVDRNWIFLSRDLFGIPRRILLEFREGRAVADRPVAAVAGWALWLAVAVATVIVTQLRLRLQVVKESALTGPLPAFVFLGAWLCSYRFMYYDALIAPLGVAVLMADPRPYFRRAWWPFASWASILVAVLLVIENATAPLNVEVSASVMGLRKSITGPDGVTQQTAPTIYLATGDYYPWDTVVVFLLWLWCAVRRQPAATETPGSPDAG